MKKITVKHYLEKRVKPETKQTSKGEITIYPIYFKVIYNKLATNKRSRTLILTTEESFKSYLKTGKLIETETFTQYNTNDSLQSELIDVSLSVKLIDEMKIKINRKTLLLYIDGFSKPVNKAILSELWHNSFIKEVTIKGNKEYMKFINSFNQNKNLIHSIEEIKKYTGIDLMKHVKAGDLIKWDAVKYVQLITEYETVFATFYYSNYKESLKKILSKKTVSYYEKIIENIEDLLKSLIQGVKISIEPPPI